MPTPAGYNFDSIAEAEEYHAKWPRLRCHNPQCQAERIGFENEIGAPCVVCAIPKGKAFQYLGALELVPLEESDPYLFYMGLGE